MIESLHGSFLDSQINFYIGGTLALVLLFGYFGLPLALWAVLGAVALHGFGAPVPLTLAVAGVALIFALPPLRQILVSSVLLKLMKGIMPKISDTERTALEAGVVWTESDLFSGRPNFKRLLGQAYPKLTKEETDFLNGPVNKVCEMIDEWQVWKTRDLSKEAFEYLKKQKFLGMIIPKEYGGLGFSHAAHSAVIKKLSTRSVAATVTTMVPNSLGPAELLVHYGTEAQKKKYLPRLAVGDDIPCFGLTEPQAGSDAGSITSEAVLFKGPDGRLKMRMQWRKRWITLASISTVIGLAFRLRDPENLLGKGEDLGITCALIPSNAPGAVVGRRHDPMGVPFNNCPIYGKNVEVDAEDSIIGGLKMAGQGWGMLMESLGAGRGISLPAQACGGLMLAARVVTNHAVIRKQFGLSIGKFEGVEEPIARVAGGNYLVEAMRNYTLSALDQGIKPPVVTAIAKYNSTEIARKLVNDALDVLGGTGISMGPRNTLALCYISTPVGITVEGANILTRTLMIFGQGALRAHPYAYKEVKAVGEGNIRDFDRAFWGHMGHIVRNAFRSFVLSLTRGYLVPNPGGGLGRYYQKLAWTSASFAIMADLAMGVLGGKLKFKEKLTGRYADILSWMYIATAVFYRYESEGRRREDLPFAKYALQLSFYNIQEAFTGIFKNFEAPLIGWVFRGPLKWWSGLNSLAGLPSDDLTHQVAKLSMEMGEQRDRMTSGIFYPVNEALGLGLQELAYKTVRRSEEAEKKIREAVKAGKLKKAPQAELIEQAVNQALISRVEAEDLKKAEELRWKAIQVDDFSEEQYHAQNSGGAHTCLFSDGAEGDPFAQKNQSSVKSSGPGLGGHPQVAKARS